MSAETIIAAAQGYANDVKDAAISAIEDATASVQAVGYIVPNYAPVELPERPDVEFDIEQPPLDAIEFLLPDEPGDAPEYQDIATIEPGAAPTLSAATPVIVMPSTPSQLAEFQGAAPDVNVDLPFPEVPALLQAPPLDLPNMPDRQAPTAPQILLPSFDAQAPVDTTAAPTDLDQQFDAAYRSASPQMVTMANGYADAWLEKIDPTFHTRRSSMDAQLAKYLTGGTALSPEVEAGMYERDRDRVAGETRRALDATMADFADRGFTLPPGALFSAMNQARQAGTDNMARASNAIAIAQAQMEQQNLQFAITTMGSLRGTMINATLSYMGTLVQINGQALEYARTVLTSVIEVYNISVRVFAARLDAYKAEAMVYETRLKGALAAVELYKAEIDALQALTNVDKAKVDIYRARIDALNGLAGVYKAQVDAVLGRASLEKMKIDVFQARVQAFTAMVQAKNGEWNAYQAQLQGQAEKVRIFTAQVQAHSVNVQAWRGRIEALAESVRAQAISNQARSEQYRAKVGAFGAIVTARGEVARTQLQVQSQVLQAFNSRLSAAVKKADVNIEYFKSVSAVVMENGRNNLAAQLKHADSAMQYGQTLAQLSASNSRSYAGLASASMSGMNALAADIKNS